MRKLDLTALLFGAATSAIALTDAVWNALASRPAPWDESRSNVAVIAVVVACHLGAFLLFAAVLLVHARAIDVNRVARWARLLLVADFLALSLAYALYLSVWHLRTPEDGPGAALFGITFALMFLLPVVLGLALVRRRELRASALVLAAPLVLVPVIVLLTAFTDWGHPGYAETAVYLGVPLLGLAADARSTARLTPPRRSPAPAG